LTGFHFKESEGIMNREDLDFLCSDFERRGCSSRSCSGSERLRLLLDAFLSDMLLYGYDEYTRMA